MLDVVSGVLAVCGCWSLGYECWPPQQLTIQPMNARPRGCPKDRYMLYKFSFGNNSKTRSTLCAFNNPPIIDHIYKDAIIHLKTTYLSTTVRNTISDYSVLLFVLDLKPRTYLKLLRKTMNTFDDDSTS